MKTRSVFLLLMTAFALFLPLVQVSIAGPPYSWTGPTLIAGYSGQAVGDVLPTVMQAANGTLWLAYQTDRNNLLGGISYKTMTAGTWSTESGLPTTNTGTNISPYITQFSNRTVALFWARRPGTTGPTNIYYKRYLTTTNTWSTTAQLTNTLLNDTDPSGTLAPDGTLWLFWQRSNKTCSSCSDDLQLYYKTLANGVWSSDAKLTSDTNQNIGPSAMFGKDGKLRLVFSKGQYSLDNFQIYTTLYNGTAWNTPSQLVSSSSSDEHPSIIQDRNGTMWLFWGRQASTSSSFYYILFNKYSTNNGQSWSADAQMSSESSGITSQTPVAVQDTASDKSVRVFYISDRSSAQGLLQVWDFLSPSISPVHDLKVSFVSPSTSFEYQGGLASIGQSAIVTITVGVANIGDFSETVTVSTSVSNRTIYNLSTQSGPVPLGGSLVLTFSWNTTGVTPARYTVTVNAVTASGETVGNNVDNSYSQRNAIHVDPLGDVDQNGSINVIDVGVCVYGFGSSPGNSKWNPYCDINNNGFIDVIDVGVVVHEFGMVS